MEKKSESESNIEAGANVAESRSRCLSEPTSYTNLDAEKVLERFGIFGTYQMLAYAIIHIGYFLYASEGRIFPLIMKEPKFLCSTPERFNTTSDQCEYFDSEIGSITQCSNFSYIEDKYAYLTSEFDLVCEKANYGERSMSLYMLGTMLFTPILTQLADLYGRRITYLITVWLSVLANIGCAFAPNYIWFTVFIFMAGVGATGLGVIGFVIKLESITQTLRSYTPLISTIAWVSGYTVVGIIHIYVKSWRRQLLVLAAPFILTISYYWILPESIHWLITHNKIAGVKKWIKTSEKVNRKKLNLEECKSSSSLDSSEGHPEKDNVRRTFVDLFSNGPMRFQLLSHCYIMMVTNFTYWALSIFSTELHENKMVGYFLSGFVELPATGAIFLLMYFGRRTVAGFSFFFQATVMCIAVFYPGKNLISMILFLLVKCFNGISWVAEPLLIGEMAPTSTRNMFYGVVTFIGTIGSVVAPYFNHLKAIHETAPAIAVALLSLIAGLLTLCSPETRNVPMPEDIDDFDPGPVYSWIFGKSKKSKTSNVELNGVHTSQTPILENIMEKVEG